MQNLAMELVESKETHVSIGREAEFYFVLAFIQMHTVTKLYGLRKMSFFQK